MLIEQPPLFGTIQPVRHPADVGSLTIQQRFEAFHALNPWVLRALIRMTADCAEKGFGRIGTDANGAYAFDTIKPGSVPDPDGKLQAPHIVLAVYARGMLLHLYSRIYFDGEAANAADPVLALVPQDRRATLIAIRQPVAGSAVYRFDIHLQGDNETVFFDV